MTQGENSVATSAQVVDTETEKTIEKQSSLVTKGKPSKFKPILVMSKATAKRKARACLVGQLLQKAVATQDASRFIGTWIVLEAGKEVEAPQYVIENLRRQKLVE